MNLWCMSMSHWRCCYSKSAIAGMPQSCSIWEPWHLIDVDHDDRRRFWPCIRQRCGELQKMGLPALGLWLSTKPSSRGSQKQSTMYRIPLSIPVGNTKRIQYLRVQAMTYLSKSAIQDWPGCAKCYSKFLARHSDNRSTPTGRKCCWWHRQIHKLSLSAGTPFKMKPVQIYNVSPGFEVHTI
jgi:hypothetical protein